MKIPGLKKNKYIYTILAFLVWITFFDANNLIYQVKVSSELERLENQKSHYLTEIKKDSLSIYNLTSNLDNLEKFAREHHLMKKDNEILYLIVKE